MCHEVEALGQLQGPMLAQQQSCCQHAGMCKRSLQCWGCCCVGGPLCESADVEQLCMAAAAIRCWMAERASAEASVSTHRLSK